jgi:peptidoglycan/xylan/chitin deacetylase (PgdA/CDA1 family)
MISLQLAAHSMLGMLVLIVTILSVRAVASSAPTDADRGPGGRMRVIILAILALPLPSATCSQTRTIREVSQTKAVREVAFTFDDLPGVIYGEDASLKALTRVTDNLLASVKRNNVPAIGFVNEGKLHRGQDELKQRTALLQMWLDAGLDFGNHTYSHIWINDVSLEQYEKDVIRGEPILKELLSKKG